MLDKIEVNYLKKMYANKYHIHAMWEKEGNSSIFLNKGEDRIILTSLEMKVYITL